MQTYFIKRAIVFRRAQYQLQQNYNKVEKKNVLIRGKSNQRSKFEAIRYDF